MSGALPTDAKARKDAPMYRGLLKYFPKALAYVAEVSRIGNEQHNPGEEMYWARGKSMDQGDALVRHQCEAGGIDSDGVRHSGKVAWRALAQLEIELEAVGIVPVRKLPDNGCRHEAYTSYRIGDLILCSGCEQPVGKIDP